MTDLRVDPFRRVAAGLLIVSSLAVASCDERLSDITGPSPNLQPTLSSISTEIFETTDLAGRTSCVTCHTNVGHPPAGNLNLAGDPYAALVDVPSAQRPAQCSSFPVIQSRAIWFGSSKDATSTACACLATGLHT